MVPVAERSGVIHDLGYRRYDGPRHGAATIARTLYVTGLRHAFGLGRSGRSKVLLEQEYMAPFIWHHTELRRSPEPAATLQEYGHFVVNEHLPGSSVFDQYQEAKPLQPQSGSKVFLEQLIRVHGEARKFEGSLGNCHGLSVWRKPPQNFVDVLGQD